MVPSLPRRFCLLSNSTGLLVTTMPPLSKTVSTIANGSLVYSITSNHSFGNLISTYDQIFFIQISGFALTLMCSRQSIYFFGLVIFWIKFYRRRDETFFVWIEAEVRWKDSCWSVGPVYKPTWVFAISSMGLVCYTSKDTTLDPSNYLLNFVFNTFRGFEESE